MLLPSVFHSSHRLIVVIVPLGICLLIRLQTPFKEVHITAVHCQWNSAMNATRASVKRVFGYIHRFMKISNSVKCSRKNILRE